MHTRPLPLCPEPTDPLSPREREVLRLAAEGYTDAEIAQVLAISRGTVRTHVRRIRKKTSARSRTEALARVLMGEGLDESG